MYVHGYYCRKGDEDRMSEKLRLPDKPTAQLMIEEMQEMYEKQKELLQEQGRKIEELKKLFDDSEAGEKQEFGAGPQGSKNEFEAVYGLIDSLEKYMAEEVLFFAAQKLAEVMDTKDVAIYTVANRDYARLFSATSPDARQLGNSIKYTDMGDMSNELKNGRIYLNKAMEPGFPLMASAIYAEEEIRVILMFWGLPSQRLTQEEVHRLTVVGALLQNAILRANRYMTTFRRNRYLEGTNVLNEEVFTTLVKAFMEAKKLGLTECALVEIEMGYQDYESISVQMVGNIRHTDYMGILGGGKLYILLANTDLKNAEVVQERLHKLGIQSMLKEAVV